MRFAINTKACDQTYTQTQHIELRLCAYVWARGVGGGEGVERERGEGRVTKNPSPNSHVSIPGLPKSTTSNGYLGAGLSIVSGGGSLKLGGGVGGWTGHPALPGMTEGQWARQGLSVLFNAPPAAILSPRTHRPLPHPQTPCLTDGFAQFTTIPGHDRAWRQANRQGN